MGFDPQVRANWQANSAWLRERGYGTSREVAGKPGSSPLDRSSSDPRPVLFAGMVPLRNSIHARVISRQEVTRRLLKLVRPGFFAALLGR